jgi:hypothetical protein
MWCTVDMKNYVSILLACAALTTAVEGAVNVSPAVPQPLAPGDSPTFAGITTPSIVSTSTLTLTPAAGSALNVVTSTTGNFTVNADEFVVDTAVGIGVGLVAPLSRFHVQLEGRTTAYDASNWTTWGDLHVVNPHATPSGSAIGISFLSRNANENNGSAGIAAIRGAGDYEQSLAFITRPNSAVSAEQVRIASSGEVGIGRTDPVAALSMGNDKLIARDVNAGITASTTQTQGQGALTAEINEISVVANANDTVTLPSAIVGLKIVVINNGANTLEIYPASGDNLGAGVNTAIRLATGTNAQYVAYDATNWETL